MNLKYKRLLAALIDFLILGVACRLIGCVFLLFNSITANFIAGFIGAIIIIFVFPLKDCLFGYESIGKKIMGLRIYVNGERVTDKKILKKRITDGWEGLLFYPIYILKDNKSLGDERMNTEVKD